MPNQTTSKRIPISLKPDLYSIIFELSELQNKPMSKVVVELLEELEPMLVNLRDGLQELKKSTDKSSVLKALGQDMIVDASSKLGDISKEVKNL